MKHLYPARVFVAIHHRHCPAKSNSIGDDNNREHLAADDVVPEEFEQFWKSDPLGLDHKLIGHEERYRSVGLTDQDRMPSAVWTIRDGKVRAITAVPASVWDKNAFPKRPK